MTAPDPARTRRTADALMRHAARVMAHASGEWAAAMRHELAYVPDDREALRWAIGCCAVAHLTRLRQLALERVIVRAAGAALVLLCAFDAALPSMMTIADRLGVLGHPGFLAGLVPDAGAGRLVPLMQAIPIRLHLLGAIGGACYIAAAFFLFGRPRTAGVLIVAGVGVASAARVLAEPILAPIGRVTPDPSLVSAVLVPVAVPLLIAMCCKAGPCPGPARQQSNHGNRKG